MAKWTCALELDADRKPAAESASALTDAIRNAADLRVGTEFRHNEHIDVTSDSAERILEAAEFGVTYLIEDRWVGGVMVLRQPISLPDGFGPRSSMSFFLYNQDGSQAIARPYLDGRCTAGAPGPSPPETPPNMPKYTTTSSWDSLTNAPSSNFVYRFDVYRFWTGGGWQEVFENDAQGRARAGRLTALVEALAAGCEVKVGVTGICAGLAAEDDTPLKHELFIQAGSCYYYSGQKLFIAGTHPIVRVRPSIPLRYASRGWDFGWLMLRTDGRAVYRRCDPYTLEFSDMPLRATTRWFIR